MTLQHVTDDLTARALTKPGTIHAIRLQRGLHLTLRYRRNHYTLSISRSGVFPSVSERAILRRSFQIPTTRKWRTITRDPMKGWYIFWNPQNVGLDAPPAPPAPGPTPPTALREITNPIQLRAAARRAAPRPPAEQLNLPFPSTVGPQTPAGGSAGDPT